MTTKKSLSIILIMLGIKVQAQQVDTLPLTYQRPLFELDYGRPVVSPSAMDSTRTSGGFRYYSFSGYREGVQPVKRDFNFNVYTQVDDRSGSISQRMYNLSIEEMVTYGMARPWQVILEVKDPSRYRYLPSYGSKLEWMRKNTYCYELTMPRELFDMKQMERDIDGFFGIRRSHEKRNVAVLILSPLEGGTATGRGYTVPTGSGVVTLARLQELAFDWGLPPLVPSLQRNDLLFDLGAAAARTESMPLEEFRELLFRQGFSLKSATQMMEFIVIRELK